MSWENLRLDRTDFTELGLGVLGLHGRRKDVVIAGEPVDGAGNTVLLGALESINDTENLGGVTASGGGVGHDQTDLLGGVDDEDGADGQSHTLGVDVGGILEVDHVVRIGDLALGVGDDGELELGAGDLIDILNPGVVGVGVVGALKGNSSASLLAMWAHITYQANELDTTSSELGLELGESTELSGTDGSEVIGVGEEDGPLVADELVEVDRAVGGVGIEVRGSRAQTEANRQSAWGSENYISIDVRSSAFSHCDSDSQLR
jgi:hypothetical protein